MADQETKQDGEEEFKDTDSSEDEAAKPKKSGPSPLVLIVSALVTFIVFLGVFSFMMGVFDDAPTGEATASQSADATTEGSANYESQPIVAEHTDQQETDSASSDSGIEFNFGSKEIDTLAEYSWIES